MSTDIEEALRAELAARAETARLRPDFQDALERGIGRDKVRRRVAGGSALALFVAAAVAAAVILNGGASTPAPAHPPTDLSRFSLLQIPTRGSLAHDAAFVADAMRTGRAALDKTVADYEFGPLDPSSFRLLYAGDDGVLRFVVVAGIFNDPHATPDQPSSATSIYDVLIGQSGARAADLHPQAFPGTSQGESAFAVTGESAGPGKPTPLIVLGPTQMTDIQYSPGVTLDKTLHTHRTGVPLKTVDGAAIGEIPGTSSVFAAYGYSMGTAFKATVNGHTTYDFESAASMPAWVNDAISRDPAIVAAHQNLRNLLVQKASGAGLRLGPDDALILSVQMALEDLAIAEHSSITDVQYTVAWIGREDTGLGAVVLDVTVPGLPALQLFADAAAGGANMGDTTQGTLIRLEPSHDAGHVPTTRAQFTGGVSFGQDEGRLAGFTW